MYGLNFFLYNIYKMFQNILPFANYDLTMDKKNKFKERSVLFI